MDLLSQFKPALTLMKVEGANHLAIHYQQAVGAQVTPQVMVSQDLVNWEPDGDLLDIEIHEATHGNQGVIACLKESMDTSAFQYIRLGLSSAE
ncbi:MAG: hypothetical protein ACI8T1_003554 [Verrucomicrobiales bacterium]|jgi:hypothetical protein